MVVKAMIMAAGVGSRLDPLTQSTPKPLIPVANQPIMDLLMQRLESYGIKSVIANTHFLAEQIQEKYVNSNPTGVDFSYIYEKELSGTAGGMKKCEFFFEKAEAFLVMSADGLTNVDLEKLIRSHKASGAIATMGLKEVPKEEVCHFGVVVADENSKVIEFQEKPSIEKAKSNLVNTGIYVFETKIFDYIPANTFFDFAKNIFPKMLAHNDAINTCVIKEYWSDIGTLNQYRLSSQDVLNNLVDVNIIYPESEIGWCAENSMISTESVKNGRVLIGEGSVVESGAELNGGCIIGNNCIVRQGAKLTGCILWDNVIIEENTVLNNCIVGNNTIINKNMELEKDSVIGANLIVESDSEFVTV